MTDRPNSEPSAEMREVLAELVRLKNRHAIAVPIWEMSAAVEVAFERARAILSALPERVERESCVRCGRSRTAPVHEGLRGIQNHDFVSQPSTTSEKS